MGDWAIKRLRPWHVIIAPVATLILIGREILFIYLNIITNNIVFQPKNFAECCHQYYSFQKSQGKKLRTTVLLVKAKQVKQNISLHGVLLCDCWALFFKNEQKNKEHENHNDVNF